MEKLETIAHIENSKPEEKTENAIDSFCLGVGVGVATRLILGKMSYQLPGGALAVGLAISSRKKASKKGYLINITGSEAGYYAGIAATEYILDAFK